MHEIDYLYVGDKTNTGDAIACRFTDPATGQLAVVVIDGGFVETGTRLVEHIRDYYDTSVVDLVVCTHPDNDHIMGLFTVIEELDVKRLLIHRPVSYGYTAADGVKADLVEDLVAAARAYGVEVQDTVFAGSVYFGGALVIAGPTEDYYRETLSDQEALNRSVTAQLSKAASSWAHNAVRAVAGLLGDPGETMIGDNGGTTPRNNSSVVVDLQVDGKRVLFTGDAGVPALTRAADTLDSLGRSFVNIDLFDVPHHGSRHNLTPELLSRLLGGKGQIDMGIAVASVGAQAVDHPRPELANALRRRGYPVHVTRGRNLLWSSDDAPTRWNYNTSSSPLGWLNEDQDDAGAA